MPFTIGENRVGVLGLLVAVVGAAIGLSRPVDLIERIRRSGQAVTSIFPILAAADPCSVKPSSIACENSKPGNPPSEWDVPGTYPQYGDLSIQGFTTDLSVDIGETVHFKINTNAAGYRLDIYRLG